VDEEWKEVTIDVTAMPRELVRGDANHGFVVCEMDRRVVEPVEIQKRQAKEREREEYARNWSGRLHPAAMIPNCTLRDCRLGRISPSIAAVVRGLAPPVGLAQKVAQKVESYAANDVLEDVNGRLFLIDVRHSVALRIGPTPLHT